MLISGKQVVQTWPPDEAWTHWGIQREKLHGGAATAEVPNACTQDSRAGQGPTQAQGRSWLGCALKPSERTGPRARLSAPALELSTGLVDLESGSLISSYNWASEAFIPILKSDNPKQWDTISDILFHQGSGYILNVYRILKTYLESLLLTEPTQIYKKPQHFENHY